MDTFRVWHGRCGIDGCHTRERFQTPGFDRPPVLFCRVHHLPVRWTQVTATYDPTLPCDSTCSHARGDVCRCSCAGANHGVAWTAPTLF